MLDIDSTAPFLLSRGLIDTECIIDGALTIRCEARRNRNVRVEGPGGKGFLIKQPEVFNDDGGVALATEAAFHRICCQSPSSHELAQIVPRLIDVDPGGSWLIFELIAGARPFQSVVVKGAEQTAALSAAKEFGTGLAKVHHYFRAATNEHDESLAPLARALPWATGLHRPAIEILSFLSAANSRTIEILQTDPGLAENLDRLREEWQPATVIHGDVRFDNVLVQNADESAGSVPVRTWLVDWETAQIGDPAWDLAGALHDFLATWVRSMPMTEELTAEERSTRAEVPLSGLRPMISALWQAYRTTADLPRDDADKFLERAVKYSGARLIQSAYEMSSDAQLLSGPPVLLLQVASHILVDPRRAQVELCGIPWRDSFV